MRPDPLSRRRLLALSLGSAAAALAASAAAQERGTRPPPGYPILQRDPASHALHRAQLEVAGLDYELFAAIPRGPAPAAGWPALTLLDGNAAFDRLTPAALQGCTGLALLGLGYPGGPQAVRAGRTRDYTPPPLPAAPGASDGYGHSLPEGGAPGFLDRLTGPIRARLAGLAPLDPQANGLWGHSYGGLFALFALLTRPAAFTHYFPTSPSTGFGHGALAALAATAPRAPQGRRLPVLIQLGDHETRRGSTPPPQPQPNPATLVLARQLAARPDLAVTLQVLQGLGHGATFAASQPAAFAGMQES